MTVSASPLAGIPLAEIPLYPLLNSFFLCHGTCTGFVGTHAVSSTSPKARTGKVPMLLILTGTAKKRKPAPGSWSNPRRCSTMGTSSASKIECTGRARSGIVNVERVDPHERHARLHKVEGRVPGRTGARGVFGQCQGDAVPSPLSAGARGVDAVGCRLLGRRPRHNITLLSLEGFAHGVGCQRMRITCWVSLQR